MAEIDQDTLLQGNPEEQTECAWCRKTFKDFDALVEHVEKAHPKDNEGERY